MATKIERADALRWIQAQAEYGLTLDELEAAGRFAPPPPAADAAQCGQSVKDLPSKLKGETDC